MRKLVVKDGSPAHEYALLEPTIIGRGESSTIRLDASKVADEHAKISRAGPNIFVEDLDTPHGITVNGKKVARWALKKGDLIGVGAVTLLYDEDDKPEPAPKPVEPPKPAKSEPAPEKKKSSTTSNTKVLPAIKLPANGNGNGNGHSKSAAGLTAIKSTEPKAELPGKSATDPAAGKSSAGIPAAKNSPSSAASSKSAIVSAVVAKSGGTLSSAKTSQSMSAVVGPASLNEGNSSRINIAAVKPTGASTSSSGLGGVTGGSSGSGGIGSKSGILSAATSGKRPGAGSGKLTGPGSNDSSARMSSASAAAVLAQRIANAPTQAAEARNTEQPGSKTLLIAVGVLGFMVLMLAGILIFSWSRGRGVSSEEKIVLERLHSHGAKTSDDLQFVMQRLRGAHQLSDVSDILGEPDLKLKGEITLWDPQMGSSKVQGQSFIAYYIKAQNEPSAIEEAPMASVLLFEVTDGRVEFIGPKNYARFPVDPEKKSENPLPINPIKSLNPIKPGAQRVLPGDPARPSAPPAGPKLPMPDDKPPTTK
jgi:hypothetical protein